MSGVHLWLWVPCQLRFVRSQFLGPRTNIRERIASGQRGVTLTDTAACYHDLSYFFVTSEADEFACDQQLYDRLVRIRDKQLDCPINTDFTLFILKAKLLLRLSLLGGPNPEVDFQADARAVMEELDVYFARFDV